MLWYRNRFAVSEDYNPPVINKLRQLTGTCRDDGAVRLEPLATLDKAFALISPQQSFFSSVKSATRKPIVQTFCQTTAEKLISHRV
jgi:hypothetical protein